MSTGPNVLICDDSDAKVDRVKSVLHEFGVKPDAIVRAKNASETRQLLQNTHFDLMILDLVLPTREGSVAQAETGSLLLADLLQTRSYRRPTMIIGLSEYDEVLAKYVKKFEHSSCLAISYKPDIDDWAVTLSSAINSLRLMEDERNIAASKSPSVCIVTAVQIEFDAVLNLPFAWQPIQTLTANVLTRSAEVTISGTSTKLVAVLCPRMGPIAAALTASKVVAEYSPKALLMAGICAGREDKNRFGDLVVAEQSWEWQGGKITGRVGQVWQRLPRPEFFRADSRLVSPFQKLKNEKAILAEIRQKWTGARPNEALDIAIGAVATGSAVLASKENFQEIVRQHDSLVGLDMETAAIYAVAHHANPPIPCVSVKSICDFGNENKDDTYQSYAAYTSAEAIGWLINNELGQALTKPSA